MGHCEKVSASDEHEEQSQQAGVALLVEKVLPQACKALYELVTAVSATYREVLLSPNQHTRLVHHLRIRLTRKQVLDLGPDSSIVCRSA